MRILICVFHILSISQNIYGQFQTEWVKSISGTHDESVFDMALDSQGNMVLLGSIDDYFDGPTCDLDPGPDSTLHTSSPDGWSNIMMAKYDSLGNHIWSFVLWDEALDPEATKLEVDDQDNIFITGYLTRAVDFDPGPGAVILNANINDYKTLFLAKYSPEGDLIWADIFEGNSSCTGFQVLTKGENIYLCGEASKEPLAGFNDSTTIINAWNDYANGFIAKYDQDLNHIWSGAIAAGPGVYNVTTCIAVDDNDDLFAAGTFSNEADFCPTDTGEVILNSPGPWDDYSSDMFIAKYDDQGQLINAVNIGSDVEFERLDEVFDMKVDLDGNVLVTGWFSGTIDFDPSVGIFNLSGESDIFLAKYNSDLELIWAFALAGTYYDIGKEIELDSENNVLLYGQYYWNGDFDPGPNEYILEGSNQNTFLAMYDENGNFIAASSLPSASSFGYECHGMEIGENGAVYLAGYYYVEEDWDLDEDDVIILENQGAADIVLAKFQYYDPIAPYLQGVIPSQIVDNGAVTLSITGFDMEEVLNVTLNTATDTILHQALIPISELEIDVLFGMENEEPGLRDLHVQLTDTLMILEQSVEILPPALNYATATIDYLSAQRILVNRSEPSIGLIVNTGSQDLVAFPVVYRGISDVLQFENNMPIEYLNDHSEFDALSAQLSLLGLNDSIMNDIVMQASDGDMVAMVIPYLTAEDERALQLRITGTESTPSNFNMIVHSNGLLPSDALIPGFTPSPTACTYEMFAHAVVNSAFGLDLEYFESCFNSSYPQMQEFLHTIIQNNTNQQKVIPLKGLMMKAGLDIIQCMDPGYEVTADVMDSIAVHMTRLLGTTIFFEPDFDCSNYVAAAELYRESLDSDEDNQIDYESSYSKDTGQAGSCAAAGISFGYGCGMGNNACIDPVSSLDPNEKYGPTNPQSGTQYLNERIDLNYSIHFENDSTAQVAAKQVFIVDSLDTEVYDLASVNFLYAHWGDTIVSINSGSSFIDLRPTLPNILEITALADSITGVITIDFQTLDTLTMLLTLDLDQGFLPPNQNSPEGMGSVSFTVDLKDGIPSGTAFENDALIYFDYNDPISTAAWTNVYDTIAPSSHVTESFELTSDEMFMVHWESDDPADPPYLYAIFVSENSPNDWQLWQDLTAETEAEFSGTIGNTYYFYSLALDSAMNLETMPSKYDAFFMLNPDGLGEMDQPSLLVAPNPTHDILNIQLEPFAWNSIDIFDMLGKRLSSIPLIGESRISLDLSQWASGPYLLKANSEGHQVIKRIIKR